MNILIVYGTRNGQTRKIADGMAQTLREAGAEVDLLNAKNAPLDFSLDGYDGVMAGASINTGKLQPCLGEFAEAFRGQLARIPTAFFTVSLSEADPNPRLHADLRKQSEDFLAETGWSPTMSASFAGALPPSRFQWMMRLFWRRLDRARDEFTDWAAVRDFTSAFARAVSAIQQPTVTA